MNLYLTADEVGIETGGGKVTYEEYDALKSLGETQLISRKELEREENTIEVDTPWLWDRRAYYHFGNQIKLAHIYAGTFSDCVGKLKANGTKVTYTAAAHDVNLSRREHEKLGVPYDYPHLTDLELLKRYLKGYLDADVLICPSQHSADVMRAFGATNRIEIIPHGIHLPTVIKPFPQRFTVGYLGSCGAPDKGLIYLLQAWKQLNYKDAVLVLGGSDSTSPWARHLINTYGGGNIWCKGWIRDVADFYNEITLYVQPSVSEGFGIEVLEAMSYGRPVICSKGAGASDVVYDAMKFNAGDVDGLVRQISWSRAMIFVDTAAAPIASGGPHLNMIGSGLLNTECIRQRAADYTWDKVKARYVALWKSLLEVT